MGRFIIFFILFSSLLLSFKTYHKYHVSITQIEYSKNTKSLQIITRIFIDDLEVILKKRYNDSLTLAGKNEPKLVDFYIEKYLQQKLKINVNSKEQIVAYLGKQYKDDIAHCYLEIENISTINNIEITNKVLFDLFDDQQNVIRTNINSKQKSIILIAEKDKALLNF